MCLVVQKPSHPAPIVVAMVHGAEEIAHNMSEHRLAGRERGDLNELSSSQRKTIRHQFDSYCKKVLRGEYHDCLRETRRVYSMKFLFQGCHDKS